MCKDHPNEQIVGFLTRSQKFMCNTCIFLSGNPSNSGTPGGPQDHFSDEDVTPGGPGDECSSGKKLQPITNNDIKIISLMALELKNTFDRQFNDYKDNMVQLRDFVGTNGGPGKFSAKVEDMIS